jgi:hypothetical protein
MVGRPQQHNRCDIGNDKKVASAATATDVPKVYGDWIENSVEILRL